MIVEINSDAHTSIRTPDNKAGVIAVAKGTGALTIVSRNGRAYILLVAQLRISLCASVLVRFSE